MSVAKFFALLGLLYISFFAAEAARLQSDEKSLDTKQSFEWPLLDMESNTSAPSSARVVGQSIVRKIGALALGDGFINNLVWNVHAECYDNVGEFNQNFGTCEREVTEHAHGLLYNGDIDFASFIYSDGHIRAPDSFSAVRTWCPLRRSFYKGGDTMLVYRNTRWKRIEGIYAKRGCASPSENHRPYTVQAFEHVTNGMKVIVAAAHFPHSRAYYIDTDKMRVLRQAIKRMLWKVGTGNVILLADTNMAPWKTSRSIMRDLHLGFKSTHSTQLFNSCCYSMRGARRSFTLAGFDRIISNFGTYMNTVKPLEKTAIMKWGARNMHLPVMGSIALTKRGAGVNAFCRAAKFASRKSGGTSIWTKSLCSTTPSNKGSSVQASKSLSDVLEEVVTSSRRREAVKRI